MKTKFIFLITSIVLCPQLIFAQTPVPTHTLDPGVEWRFKDGEIIQVPVDTPTPTPLPGKTFTDGVGRSTERAKEYARSMGFDENEIGYDEAGTNAEESPGLKYFQLPAHEIIEGCLYTTGYSFPNFCFEWNDKEGKDIKVFEAGKDPQTTLDALKKKYGIKGVYNVVPKGYFARPPRALENADSHQD